MDLDEIKEIIQKSGGKFIIVENGKPEMVVMSFEDFKKDYSSPTTHTPPPTVPVSKTGEKLQVPKELEEEPLKIEDLPF